MQNSVVPGTTLQFSRSGAANLPGARSHAEMASRMKDAAGPNSSRWTLTTLVDPQRTATWQPLRFSHAIACLLVWVIVGSRCVAQMPVNVGESGSFQDVLIRDQHRRAGRLTSIASMLPNKEQLGLAIDQLQLSFDFTEDTPLPKGDPRGLSFRVAAARLLREAGKDVWARYEADKGPEANRLLERADATGDIATYHEIVRRFAHTVAGSHALDRLANWYFDRGDFDLAVSCWNNLFSNPVHADRISNLQYFKLVIAANRCGIGSDFQLLETSLESQKLVLGGQARKFEEWQARLNPPTKSIANTSSDWQFFGGSNERTHINAGSVPFLRSSFKLSLFDSKSPATANLREREGLDEARQLLERELSDRRGVGLAFGFAGSPLVTRDWIILRDALGIRALDRRDHRTLWTHRTATTLTVENASFNELEATNLRQSSFLQNSVLCQLASDERHVYFVDQNSISDRPQATLQFDAPDVSPRADGKPFAPPWNRLVALRLVASPDPSTGKNREGGTVAWTLGGHPFDEPDAPLKGHFFLGPPLPVGRLLYVVSEFQKKLFYLTALQPDTGRVLWSQTLAFVPNPSRETPMLGDRPRLSAACFIAGARGVLVCPLGAGILVGMDQLTGEFLWLHDYRWRPKSRNLFAPTLHNSVEQSLEADFPNPPLIHSGRIYFLAPGDAATNFADHVHCLDLKTGAKIWHTECRDSKYLAVLNDDQLLAVGGNFVQSLSTKDGSTQWSKRVPVVAGVGAVVQQNYLLPVSDGRVMWLNGKDGSEIGYSLPMEGMQIGNLIVHGTDVMSENGLELQVFPQATELLAELERRPEADRDRFADLLETGEVYFRLGRLEEAKNHLKRALFASKSGADRSTVLNTTRELAWRELRQFPERRPAALADFEAACELPEHRAQYLLAKGEIEVGNGDWASARKTSRELLDLNIEQPMRSLDDTERNLTADAWSSTLANRIAQEAPALTELLAEEPTAREIIEKGSLTQLRSFLLKHPNLPESSQVRRAMARRLLDDGQAQAAELALWYDHLKNDAAALAACQFLVELWAQSGLYEEAGRLLHRIGTELGDVKGPDGQTGFEYYSSFPKISLVWTAAQRFVPLDWKVERVTITQGHDIDRRLKATFSNWPRSLYFPQSSNQFFLVGQTAPFYLRQIDTETGSVVADFSLPTGNRIFYPHQFLDVRQRMGHFLPSAGSANAFGISLLDRGIVWQQTTATSTPNNSVPWIGPTSPSSCVFRSRNRLFSLDPSNGKLIWERTDLEEVPRPLPNLTAIPGDDEAILLVEPDEFKTYRVYRRTDGSLIREGQLKNCAAIHDHFGRNLLYDIPETPLENRGIRLWDPLTDQTLFEFRNPKREMAVLTSQMSNQMMQPETDAEFAIAEPTGRVRIIDGNNGKVKLEVALGPTAIRGAPPIKLFSDASRFYLNIQNNPAIGGGISTTYADTTFQTHQVMGDLYAFDRRTGEKLWMRKNMLTQSIVHLADYNLPFLVSLNRTGRQNRINNFIGLKLEVIDGQTGQTLAIQSNGLNDRLFLMDYDRDLGRLRFRGGLTQLQVNFGPKLNGNLLEPEELVDFHEMDLKPEDMRAD